MGNVIDMVQIPSLSVTVEYARHIVDYEVVRTSCWAARLYLHARMYPSMNAPEKQNGAKNTHDKESENLRNHHHARILQADVYTPRDMECHYHNHSVSLLYRNTTVGKMKGYQSSPQADFNSENTTCVYTTRKV